MVLGLLDAGEKVVVLDDLSTGFDWAVSEPARLVAGDTGDANLVARPPGRTRQLRPMEALVLADPAAAPPCYVIEKASAS